MSCRLLRHEQHCDDVGDDGQTKADQNEDDGQYPDKGWVQLEVFRNTAAHSGENAVVASVESFVRVHRVTFIAGAGADGWCFPCTLYGYRCTPESAKPVVNL
jgi:hypothetical protein